MGIFFDGPLVERWLQCSAEQQNGFNKTFRCSAARTNSGFHFSMLVQGRFSKAAPSAPLLICKRVQAFIRGGNTGPAMIKDDDCHASFFQNSCSRFCMCFKEMMRT